MRKMLAAAMLGLVVPLAACGTQHPAHPAHAVTSPAAAVPSSAAPVATANASAGADAHACWAFQQATTRGVPPSAAGEDTMTWLQSQVSAAASPAMINAIQRYANAWQMADPGKIGRAGRAIKRLCAAV